MRLALRRLKRRIKLFRSSVRNALRAFQPNEIGYTLAIDRFGDFEIAYRAGTADEGVIHDTCTGDFFAEIPEYRPGSGDTILDVGAHIGTFGLLAARLVPDGVVHAVEASRESFHYLRLNALLNGCGNLHPHHLALSDHAGTTRLYHDHGNWGHSVTAELSTEFETVPTDTLAGFMDRNGIGHCHFAKFNCEGAEFPILMAAGEETLRRIGAMLVLYHSDLAVGYGLEDLVRKLEGAGFTVRFQGRKSTRGKVVAFRG